MQATNSDVENWTKAREDVRKEQTDVARAASDPNNGVMATRYRNIRIDELTNPQNAEYANTGQGATAWARIASATARTLGVKDDAPGTPIQKVGHYLAQSTAALAQRMGVPNTNMGAEQASAAAGNVEQNPAAIREIAHVNDAMNTAFDYYNRGLAAVSKGGSDPSRVAAFRQEFGKSVDLDALRWEDAVRRHDQDEANRIAGNMSPERRREMKQHLTTLRNLATKGDLE